MITLVLVRKSGLPERTVRTTESPEHRYQVEIVKRQFFVEHAVYLNAYRGQDRVVNRELLFTGDFLDAGFQERYPNYLWVSENILRIGRNDVAERASEIVVSNESASAVSYLLLETMGDKAIIFDLAPETTVHLSFPFADERFSGLCEMAATGKRFGAGVELADKNNQAPPDRIKIRLTKEALTIEATEQQLKPSYCCAPDRPAFDHQSQY